VALFIPTFLNRPAHHPDLPPQHDRVTSPLTNSPETVALSLKKSIEKKPAGNDGIFPEGRKFLGAAINRVIADRK
jgi:hypothetical protein